MRHLPRNLLRIALLAAAFGAGSGSLSAQTAQAEARVQADVAASASGDAQAGVQADAKLKAGAQAARKDPNCVTQTGTRVHARGKTACIGPGRSFDRKDLESTGEVDVGQALRKLDPRLN